MAHTYVESNGDDRYDKPIELKGVGCPWCNTPPKLGVSDCKMIYYAECVNKKCHVHPRVEGGGYEKVLKEWNKRIKPEELIIFAMKLKITLD